MKKQISDAELNRLLDDENTKLRRIIEGRDQSEFYVSKIFSIPTEYETRFMEGIKRRLPEAYILPNSIESDYGFIFLFTSLPNEFKIECECFEKSNLDLFNALCDWIAQWAQVDAAKPEKPKQERGAWLETEYSIKRLREIRLDAIKNNRLIPPRNMAMSEAGIDPKTLKKHDLELYQRWDDKNYR